MTIRAGVGGDGSWSVAAAWMAYDNDGREDIFVTALSNETFPLFRNLPEGGFIDLSIPGEGVRATPMLYLTWMRKAIPGEPGLPGSHAGHLAIAQEIAPPVFPALLIQWAC